MMLKMTKKQGISNVKFPFYLSEISTETPKIRYLKNLIFAFYSI